MKYKVLVRALSIKGNKVAKFGEIIDSSQLPNPDNAEEMEKEGYFEETEVEETEAEETEVEETEVEETEETEAEETEAEETEVEEEGDHLLNREELEAMNKKDVKKYAKENDIDFNRQANKAELIDEILENSEK